MLVNMTVSIAIIVCKSKDFRNNLNYLGHSADVYVDKRMNNNKGNQ